MDIRPRLERHLREPTSVTTFPGRPNTRVPTILLSLAVVLHILSFVLMLQEIEPFYSFFYSFAWWSFILAIGSCNQLLRANSLLYAGLRPLLRVALFSNLGWMIFEAVNFRLHNWHYTGVPEEPWIRWPGYLLAFATVFPGLFETERLLRNLGLGKQLTREGRDLARPAMGSFFIIGLVMVGLTLALPEFFFPLAWVSLIFLLEPVLVWKTGGESLFEYYGRREYGLALRLLLAGLLCGLLWEFWNFRAGSKWHYTLPYFDFGRIFEMPVLGFLGFPPFALECYLINRILLKSTLRLRKASAWARGLAALASILFIALVLTGIDRWTVLSYRQVLH